MASSDTRFCQFAVLFITACATGVAWHARGELDARANRIKRLENAVLKLKTQKEVSAGAVEGWREHAATSLEVLERTKQELDDVRWQMDVVLRTCPGRNVPARGRNQ